MKAVLLVAGLGSRLRPMTHKIPKCLLPINSQPLLGIWFKKLASAGVTEVLVNTHWLADQVEDYVAQNTPSGLTVRLFDEPELLGSAGTLLANQDYLGKQTFFVIYGDNLSDVNLSDMYQSHLRHRPILTLGTFSTDSPQTCGIAEIDDQGWVQSFIEKPSNPVSNCAAAGIYVVEPEVFDYFPQLDINGQLDLGFDVIPKLVGNMHHYPINLLIDIGTPDSYRRAQDAQIDALLDI